ncbi:MAG TPA: AAA family ATPase, partial [Pseudonocardiaceae bacterium]
VAAGSHGVVELVGEPGMGKTTLLAELRSRATARGCVALAGQATEFERLPYAVFVDALDDHLGTVEQEPALAELGADWLELLSAVFPALAMGRAVRPQLAAAERHVFYRAVRALVARLHSGSGVVLLLDDLHWADEATTELLDHLLRHPPGGTPLLLALTYRPRQLPDRLATALAPHTGQPWWHRIDVCPLSSADVDELCGESVPTARRRDLYQASGGNPYYLEALIRTGPPWRPDPFGDHDLERDLPKSVWAALLGEVFGLSDTARVVAQGAAVLGEVFEAGLVAPVAEATEADTLAALDELLARDLVRPADAPQRLRFRHPLLRSVLYGTATYGWRLGAHTRAAAVLATHGASLAAQASHVERAAQAGDDDAIDVLVRAAAQVTPLAPGRAAHWLRQALRLLADRAGTRPELWLRLAHTLGVAGQLVESRDILDEALGVLPAEHRLTAVTSLAMVQRLLGQHADAKTMLLAELAAGGDLPTPATAGLELELAAGALRGSDFDGAVSWGERALASATADHDDEHATTAAALLALAHVFAGATGPATARLAAAGRVVDREADRVLATHLDAILRVGWAEVFLERYEHALGHLGRGLELARRTGQSYVL